MKTSLYKIVPNPFKGWDVKRIKSKGIIRSFEKKKDAEIYLRKIALTEPKESPVVIPIAPGREI